MLTMTPHIIRLPDITDDDMARMWVGTQNNLPSRGVSPRIESRAGSADPFVQRPEQFRNTPTLGGEPGNYIQTPPTQTSGPTPINGAAPATPFGKPVQTPPPPPNPEPQSRLKPKSS